MTQSITTKNGQMLILTPNCIVELHKLLSENYLLFHGMEPISPSGIKNNNMLESAVYRQQTGIDNYYKYDTIFKNCASLAFGIIKNHAFHNGNKRTGLLSIIKHLHANGYVLNPNLKNGELYELIVSIARDDLPEHANKYNSEYKNLKNSNKEIDELIEYIAYWIKKHSMPKSLYIGQFLKINTLKNILKNKNILYSEEGKHIILTEIQAKKIFRFLTYEEKVVKRKKYLIGKRKEKIKKSILDKIRKDFNLTRSDGVDNVAFYDDKNIIDEEIKKYKSIIYRLSKT